MVAKSGKIPESGRGLVDTLVEVNREFEEDGRFPMIGYASPEELNEVDDPDA